MQQGINGHQIRGDSKRGQKEGWGAPSSSASALAFHHLEENVFVREHSDEHHQTA
jgi:hypothetical protein